MPAERPIPAQPHTSGALADSHATAVRQLMERCVSFGVEPTTEDLLGAGLQLLLAQTETALEAAILQSLRADRSFAQRKERRRPRQTGAPGY